MLDQVPMPGPEARTSATRQKNVDVGLRQLVDDQLQPHEHDVAVMPVASEVSLLEPLFLQHVAD